MLLGHNHQSSGIKTPKGFDPLANPMVVELSIIISLQESKPRRGLIH
jgi:hypothetical protein